METSQKAIEAKLNELQDMRIRVKNMELDVDAMILELSEAWDILGASERDSTADSHLS